MKPSILGAALLALIPTALALDGQVQIYGDRQTVIDDGVSKRLTLKKGANVVRCAVINGGGATDFCARFLDDDGKPITGYTATLNEVPK